MSERPKSEMGDTATRRHERSMDLEAGSLEVTVEVPSVEKEIEMLRKHFPDYSLSEQEIEKGPSRGTRLITYGSKAVFIYRDGPESYYSMVVATDKDRISNETTVAYRKLLELLQDEANMKQSNVSYGFVTDNPKFVSWARSSGNDLFHWYNVQEAENAGDDYIFSSELKPEINN